MVLDKVVYLLTCWGSRLRFIISVPRLGIITSKPCRHSWRRGLSQVEHSIWATELIESGLSHTPSIEGMPESAQSEVAARPEAAEVPGEEKKDLNFPQLLTNGGEETSSSNSTQLGLPRSVATRPEGEKRTRFRNQMSFYGSSGYIGFSSTRTTSSSIDSWFHSSTGTDLYSIDSYRIERGSEPIHFPSWRGKVPREGSQQEQLQGLRGNEFNCWPQWRSKSCIPIFRSGFEGGWASIEALSGVNSTAPIPHPTISPIKWIYVIPTREWGFTFYWTFMILLI